MGAGYMNLEGLEGLGADAVRSLVRQENANRMQASISGGANGDDAGAADGGKKGGTVVILVVAILVIFGLVGGLFFFVTKRNAQNQPVRGAAAHYANPVAQSGMPMGNMSQMPVGAPSAGVPSWADPAVPFLSRAEAEAQLQQAGFTNGSFVIRQSTSNAKGYVVTSCNNSKIQHIQLKRQSDGNLYYGPKLCGSNVAAAIQTLQNSVPVAPKDGPQYFLRQEAGGAAGNMENSDA